MKCNFFPYSKQPIYETVRIFYYYVYSCYFSLLSEHNLALYLDFPFFSYYSPINIGISFTNIFNKYLLQKCTYVKVISFFMNFL